MSVFHAEAFGNCPQLNKAQSLVKMSGVNFQTVWGKGHTWAERKCESSANFIQWVHDCIVSEEVDEWYDDLIRMDTHLHVDLYDGGKGNFIPWEKLQVFFETNLK